LQGRKCTKGNTVRATRSSHLCLLDIPLKKLACPCAYDQILPTRSSPAGQFPFLAPEAFSSISLGFRTWCAGLCCHSGNRHHHCHSGFKSVNIRLIFGTEKTERKRRRERRAGCLQVMRGVKNCLTGSWDCHSFQIFPEKSEMHLEDLFFLHADKCYFFSRLTGQILAFK